MDFKKAKSNWHWIRDRKSNKIGKLKEHMYYILAFIIIPLFSFVLQSYPRIFNRYFGVDVWTRMIEADILRNNNHKVPLKKIKNGFLLEGYFNYPTVFPWFLSFFPKKTLFEIQGFIAPIFDVLQNILV